jgi:hypothetical protein
MEHSSKNNGFTIGTIRRSSVKAHLNVILRKANQFFEEDLSNNTRARKIAYYRYVYFYVAKKMFGDRISLTDIGLSVNRDHATVIHGIKRVEESEKYDKELYGMLRAFLEYCSIEDDENKDILDFARKMDIESLTEEVLRLRTNQLSFPILAKINRFLMECDDENRESLLLKIKTIYELNKKVYDVRNKVTAD